MNHFQITGWSIQTLALAGEKMLLLLNELASLDGGFAVEAHCKDLAALKCISNVAPSSRCAFYGWKCISSGSELKGRAFSSMRRGLLKFGHTTIYINDSLELPPYNWEGVESNFTDISVNVFHPEPLRTEEKEPSKKLIEMLSTLAVELTGENIPSLKTGTSWKETGRDHSYLLKVPRPTAVEVTAAICSKLGLHDGVGSFEFVGTYDDISSIFQSLEFRAEEFPATCWSLNYPEDTMFSYGLSVFLLPLENVPASKLIETSARIDELGEKVLFRSVVKRYIAWKLLSGTLSPRVQGNYVLISHEASRRYSIFLGYDRFEDTDPSVRSFTSYAGSVLDRMGVQLKKVSGPR